jgi:glutamine amidotransferase
MKVSIIKYNAGNVQSVLFALERIGINATVTDDIELLKTSDKIIFPGVGEASSAMKYLKEKKLELVIKNLKQPVLGICLGMQLLCKQSEEGSTGCLGIFDTKVKRFLSPFEEPVPNLIREGVRRTGDVKIPQIGWNTITCSEDSLFKKIRENEYMYFVHSYYAESCNETIATTNYQLNYSSALQKDNFYGVQFHPEKSSIAGEQLLKNFIELT